MVGHARGRRERRAAPPVGLNTLVRRLLAGADLRNRVLPRRHLPDAVQTGGIDVRKVAGCLWPLGWGTRSGPVRVG